MKVKTKTRYVLMSSDYSQQEPKLLTQLCGDENMLAAYNAGKDLYAEIAAVSFHRDYDDCLEFFPKGTLIKEVDGHWEKAEDGIPADGTQTNKEGKSYRTKAKSILLGIMYGRQEASIAEQLGCSVEEAKSIKESVYKAYPKIKQFEDASNAMASDYGYVTTLWGRKRRLPILKANYPDFEFSYVDKEGKVHEHEYSYYVDKLKKAKWFKERKAIYDEAYENGIRIDDVRYKKIDEQRKVVNARIQGSAADMTKLAMIAVDTNKKLNQYGARLAVPIHDELLITAPLRYASEVEEEFAKAMSNAASDRLHIKMSCDVATYYDWGGKEIDINEEKEGAGL